MSRMILYMILFNIAMGTLFVLSNYHIWSIINPLDYTSPNWNPLIIQFIPRYYVDGMLVPALTFVVLSNYPFWLFWIAMAGNIIIASLIHRENKMPDKQK